MRVNRHCHRLVRLGPMGGQLGSGSGRTIRESASRQIKLPYEISCLRKYYVVAAL